MANLYEKYGLKNTMANKPFSISFIDGFLSCPFRCFMTYIAGLWKDSASIPFKFGSGCHAGLARVNESMRHNRDYCKKCDKECKLRPELTPEQQLLPVDVQRKLKKEIRAKALTIPVEECKVKRILGEEFINLFSDEFCDMAKKELMDRDPLLESKDADKKIDEQKSLALDCMYEATFVTQPIGDILLTENELNSTLEGHKIKGIVDLCMMTDTNKLLVLDYKTASPGAETEPWRQLCLYAYLIEDFIRSQGGDAKVDYISVLHMIKKKRPAKPRVSFKQTDILFKDLRKEKALFPETIKGIVTDIEQIKECLDSGLFMKNRNSKSCLYCENRHLCHSDAALEKALAERKSKK